MVESALAMMEFLRPLFIVTAVALVVIVVVVMLIIIAPRFLAPDPPSEIDQMHFLCGGSYFWNVLSYKSVHYDVHVR